MSGNPKDSVWRATPREKRKRKPIALTLPEPTIELLRGAATRLGMPVSRVVESIVDKYIAILVADHRR